MSFDSGFEVLPGFVAVESCAALTNELQRLVKEKTTHHDEQCPTSEAIHGAEAFDSLLDQLLPYVEAASGKKLFPTYSYARLYRPGEILKKHRDREACEISVTLTLGFSGKPWPILISAKEDDAGTEVVMNPGDALLYRGCDMYHWREPYTEGEWQAQVFLHYVDADGPNVKLKFDGRKTLAAPKGNDMFFRVYTDVLSSADCAGLIKTYTASVNEPAGVGSGADITTDVTIRNVNRFVLPVHRGIGGRLAAVGLDANHAIYKFDITHANQSEVLKYPAGGGRYKAHIDTFLGFSDECRKLTVLAFLNDDFKGGKFFLMNGHHKVYPPQSAGTVLVFPSFIMHGVEDVEEGIRHSVVCWMVGPWFK